VIPITSLGDELEQYCCLTRTYKEQRMKRFMIVAVCAAAAACGDRDANVIVRAGSTEPTTRRDSIESAQDNLLAESMAVMEFVGELNNELARAGRLRIELSSGSAGESKIADAKREREALAKRVREILTELDSSEARLELARQQMSRLTGRESALNARVAALTSRLDSLRANAAAEQQALSARIAGLEQAILTLAGDTARLAARVAQLSDSVNTVYYIAGSEEELLERGIIVREGGRRYLFAGPRAIQPARRLSPESFKAIDMTKTSTIPLPPGQYRILSRHSVDLAKPEVLEGGKVGGSLRVTAPEEFWAGSRYLILVKA
jgi:hypothetical protein